MHGAANLVLLAAASAVLSWALGFWVLRVLAKLGLLDKPNGRSSHSIPTIRGGGLGIVVVVVGLNLLVAWWESSFSILFGAGVLALVAAVSFIDDLRGLPWSLRFGIHGIAALIVVIGVFYSSRSNDIKVLESVALGAISFLFIAGYANAFNFMDGINGISAGQTVFTGGGTVAITLAAGITDAGPELMAAMIVAGAGLGFVPHNFPYARMFMGDVGSVTLGFTLASLAVAIAAYHGWWLLIPLGLLHANFILDTGITLVRRILRGEAFHEAHREHFYQRLVQRGKSHAFVTSLEMALQIVVVALLVNFVKANSDCRLLIGLSIILLWLSFFCYADRWYSRIQRR